MSSDPRGRANGFALPEILLALTLLLVAVLAVAALSIKSLASNRKASDTQTGTLVARQVLENQIQTALSAPASAFWTHNSATPFATQTIQVGGTPYQARTFVTNVTINADPDAPTSIPIQLKRVDVVVNWWDSQSATRQGYGKLEARIYRMLNAP